MKVEELQQINEDQRKKLFVHSFSADDTDAELKEFFSQYGQVDEFLVIRDKQTQRSKRYGFCKFFSSDGVDNVQRQRPLTFKDSVLDTRRSAPKGLEGDPIWKQDITRLFVSGIRDVHEQVDLMDYFSQYGEVIKADVLTDNETGQKRGFAFVEFKDFDIVDKMCLIKSHMIKDYRCDVKKAIPREARSSRGPPSDRRSSSNQYPSRGGSSGGYRGGRGGSYNNSYSNNSNQGYSQYDSPMANYGAPSYAPEPYYNNYANPQDNYGGYAEEPPYQPQNNRYDPYKRY